MKTRLHCLQCSLKGFISLMEEFDLAIEIQEKETREYLKYMSTLDLSVPPPAIARHAHERLRYILKLKDPYKIKKDQHNQWMLEQYDELYEEVMNTKDPVLSALKLSISGNVIDYGAHYQFDVKEIITGAIKASLSINHSVKLLAALKNSDKTLYLLDNTGEIVLDKLLIQVLLEKKVIQPDQIMAATRGKPIINDATMADAVEIGLTDLIRVIDNGDCSPGTILEYTSENFNHFFNHADLIISKGQGNYETLNHINDKNIFFLLITKCPIISEELKINIGDLICQNNLQQL